MGQGGEVPGSAGKQDGLSGVSDYAGESESALRRRFPGIPGKLWNWETGKLEIRRCLWRCVG